MKARLLIFAPKIEKQRMYSVAETMERIRKSD